jgi:hypothetical protein
MTLSVKVISRRKRWITSRLAPGVKSALTSGLGTPLHPRAASSLQLKLRDDWKLRNTAKMVINPTYLAQRTRSCQSNTHTEHWTSTKANTGTAVNWTDAKKRVIHSYRDWLRSVRCFPVIGT